MSRAVVQAAASQKRLRAGRRVSCRHHQYFPSGHWDRDDGAGRIWFCRRFGGDTFIVPDPFIPPSEP
ncbi:MAG: hypothetical protein HC784_12060 [Hydrococcus sp. CSU_1_8]|nr:hypothetical protein [Hydrococcus sp. CSU_1_8]